MLEKILPDGIMKPFNNAYSHGVVIPPNARVLHVAGQVGGDLDGNVPDDFEQQAENVWINVGAIVAAAGMQASDIVKITAYIVDADIYPAYAAARTKYLGEGTPPAATAIYVPRLVLPEWKLEVEVIAARAD